MKLSLTQEESKHLGLLIDTALRALPEMIKQTKNIETRKEIREHRDAILKTKLKLNEWQRDKERKEKTKKQD